MFAVSDESGSRNETERAIVGPVQHTSRILKGTARHSNARTLINLEVDDEVTLENNNHIVASCVQRTAFNSPRFPHFAK